MWNASELLPGILLAPVTLLAGPQASLTVMLTRRLRRLGGQPVLGAAAVESRPVRGGHRRRRVRVLPGPAHLGRRAFPAAVRGAAAVDDQCAARLLPAAGTRCAPALWLGLLVAAQLFIGEELLVDAAVAAVVMVVVLVLSHPRAAVAAVRDPVLAIASRPGHRSRGHALDLAVRAVDTVPRAARLARQPVGGSVFHSYLYTLGPVRRAAVPHRRQRGGGRRLSGTALPIPGLPGLAAAARAAVAAVCFWRDPKVRLAAVTLVLLELFSLGVVGGTASRWRSRRVCSWHYLQHLPLLSDLLPDRFSILADGSAGGAARLRPGPGARAGAGGRAAPADRVAGHAGGGAGHPAVVPRPVVVVGRYSAARRAGRRPSPRLRLAPGDHVLVVPDLRHGLRWQAEPVCPARWWAAVDHRARARRAGHSYVDQRRPTATTSRGSTSGCRAGVRRHRRSCARTSLTGGRPQSSR